MFFINDCNLYMCDVFVLKLGLYYIYMNVNIYICKMLLKKIIKILMIIILIYLYNNNNQYFIFMQWSWVNITIIGSQLIVNLLGKLRNDSSKALTVLYVCINLTMRTF